MTPEKVAYALQLLAEPVRSLRSIATLIKISPTTLYKVLPELLTPEQAKARLGKQIDALTTDSDGCRTSPSTSSRSPTLKINWMIPGDTSVKKPAATPTH